MNKNTWLFYL